MNRVLVVFSDELLAQVDAARGLASRSAWIRSWCEHGVRIENEGPAVEEAVAPLVPADFCGDCGDTGVCPVCRGGGGDAYYCGACANTHKCFCLTGAPKPKARRKKATVGDLESDKPIDLMTALKASVEAKKAATIQTPARCNRGARTGTIKPNGRCIRCNQEPLKESK